MAPPASRPVLEISGHALLKIISHSHEHLPSTVSGSLLGLSSGPNSVTCSSAFGVPNVSAAAANNNNNNADEQDEPQEQALDDPALLADAPEEGPAARVVQSGSAHQIQYQREMLRLLKTTNGDANVVGWYQSMFLGTFCTAELLETQLSYQLELSEGAVVLLYDPVQTVNSNKGEIVVKAFRLTKEYTDAKTSGVKTYLPPRRVFTEMEVKVTNPSIVRALLFDLDRSNPLPRSAASNPPSRGSDYGGGGAVDFERLDLSTNPYLEKNLEFLSTWVDDLSAEQSKFQMFARQLLKEEGGGSVQPVSFNKRGAQAKKVFVDKEARWAGEDAPNRLDALLSNIQIGTYCDQVNEFADRGKAKLFVVAGAQAE